MLGQMFPWFVATLLLGLVIGLVVGMLIASAVAKGHYSHFMNQMHLQEDEQRRNYPRR